MLEAGGQDSHPFFHVPSFVAAAIGRKDSNWGFNAQTGEYGNLIKAGIIDPALVAGVTIEVGDRYMDLSAATQLKKLQSLLSTV